MIGRNSTCVKPCARQWSASGSASSRSSGSADLRRACDPTIRGAARRSTSARRAPGGRRVRPSTRRRPTRATRSPTIESIDGGRWWAPPIGSDLSTLSPVARRDPEPVRRADADADSTQPHHTPDEPCGASACSPVQPSKSPTTCTARAAGAHTANRVPPVARLGAELRVEPAVRALAEQVQVEVGDRVRRRHHVSPMRRTANTCAGPRPGVRST